MSVWFLFVYGNCNPHVVSLVGYWFWYMQQKLWDRAAAYELIGGGCRLGHLPSEMVLHQLL